MSAALYLATAFAALWGVDRWIVTVKRWVALALLLLPLCLTGRALLTDSLFGPFDLPYETDPLVWQRSEHGFSGAYNGMISDLYTQIIPYRKALRDALARGEWPLWNPYTMSGEPLAAEAQPAVYSPLTLLALLLPVAKSFTFSGTLWFFLAALGTYVFVRDLGLSELASLLAGTAFMSASAIVFFIHWPLGQTWILLPFVFVAVRRVMRAPLLLLITLTLVILTGHPESVLHVVFIGAVYGVFCIRRAILPRIGALHAVAIGTLALGLCAIYLLPFHEASLQTEQYSTRSRYFAHEKHSIGIVHSLVLLATDISSDLQQRIWLHGGGVAPYTAAVGSVALALSVFGCWRGRHSEKWFFIGLLAFCLLEHLRTPLEDVMQRLPLFDIAINDRFAFGAAFSMVVIAAMGVDALRQSEVRRFAVCGLSTLVVVLSVSYFIERIGFVAWNHEMWGEYRRAADALLLGIAVLVALWRPRIAVPTIFACLLLQRTMQENGVYPTFQADVAYPAVALFKPLEQIDTPFRIVGQSVSFLPGTNAFYGLEDVRGYSPMTLRRYDATFDLWCRRQPVFVNLVDDLNRPFLSFLNVRFGIVPKGAPTANGWKEIKRFRGTKLVENESVIERAFVPNFVHIGSPAPLMEMSLADDLRAHAWIEADLHEATRSNGPGRITSITRRKLGFDIDAVMQHDGWIVVSEPNWPGWRAYIDGRRVQHQFANVAFIGIYTPPGAHRIRLVYWPHGFVEGRAISAATLLIVIGLGTYRSERGRRKSRAA